MSFNNILLMGNAIWINSCTQGLVIQTQIYLNLINWPLSNRNSATKKHFKFVDIIIFEFLLLKYSLKHCITKNVTIWVDIIFLVLLLLKLKAIFVRVIIVSGALCSGPI